MKRLILLAVVLSVLFGSAGRNRPETLSGQDWQLRIVMQPKGCYDCVTGRMGEATLFRAAWRKGQTGLLAHDYLSGALWYRLKVGDVLSVDRKTFSITEIFTWTPPGYPGWEEADVYRYVYERPGSLTLQTCMGEGFFFVIAK